MKHRLLILFYCLGLIHVPNVAHASFLISSAILEFTTEGPKQQDIELINRSAEDDYIITEVGEMVHPGAADETRREVTDPAESWLLVTPDKHILPAGGRKLLRFVLLKPLDAEEHIYRIAVKPVIRDVENTAKVGLKILVGYEVLVIIRPATIAPAYHASRQGKEFSVVNQGNSNVLFQNGAQCRAAEKCLLPPVLRAYPGQTAHVTLPLDQPVSYSVWDGKTTVEKRF